MVAMDGIFKPHPVIPAPTPEQVAGIVAKCGGDRAAAAAMLREIEDRRLFLMQAMEDNAYEYGWEPECWRDAREQLLLAELLVLFGGNGAGKTWFMARDAVDHMVQNPKARVLLLHESENSSIDTHQQYVHHYLPVPMKPTDSNRVKRTVSTKIAYTRAGGFTDNILTLPNQAMCRFGFYNQDVKLYEGGGWTRIYADENLPLSWLRTLMYRLPRCAGKFVWSYSPIDGVTPAIKHVTEGAATVEARKAKLLPQNRRLVDDCEPGMMPYIQVSASRDDWRIMYFFSEMNPLGGYELLEKQLRLASRVEVERRAYGYARNALRQLFPRFGKVNIVEPDEVPTSGVTRYHIADPAGSRNMFMIWVAVDQRGNHWIYREWPNVPRHGDWAIPSENANRWDGDPGPAQPEIGLGIVDYKELILSEENHRWDPERKAWAMEGEEVYGRFMDPRAGAAKNRAERDGGMSLIDWFLEEQTDGEGMVAGPSMEFLAASGVREADGLKAINALLAYKPEQPIVPILNEPRLKISKACRNTIWALQNYTQHDGEKAACKDPIDCLRYMATADLEHVTPGMLAGIAGRGVY